MLRQCFLDAAVAQLVLFEIDGWRYGDTGSIGSALLALCRDSTNSAAVKRRLEGSWVISVAAAVVIRVSAADNGCMIQPERDILPERLCR